MVKIRRASLSRFDWFIYIGPWACRVCLSRYGSFGWREGDGWLTRKSRKIWSGWFRWEDDESW